MRSHFDIRVEHASRRVWIDGREIPLTKLEFQLIAALYAHRPRLQTRAVLLSEVWGASPKISTRAVDAVVARVRMKLGRAKEAIKTVHGLGYYWHA